MMEKAREINDLFDEVRYWTGKSEIEVFRTWYGNNSFVGIFANFLNDVATCPEEIIACAEHMIVEARRKKRERDGDNALGSYDRPIPCPRCTYGRNS